MHHRTRAFTLLELLVVIAIIAVVGAGTVVFYGREVVANSRSQMTLHEMQEIKKAFLRFYDDNGRRLRGNFAEHDGTSLPSSSFTDRLVDPPSTDAERRFYGQMEFFETYGLWFLMFRKTADITPNPDPEDGYELFPEFDEYDIETGEGWNGPYLDVSSRLAWVYDVTDRREDGSYEGTSFPQVADKFGGATLMLPDNVSPDFVQPLGVYRLLYYEHCENISDTSEPIYRRLLLVGPAGNTDRDELENAETGEDELLLETGNRRGANALPDGIDQGRLNLSTGDFSHGRGIFVIDLLNFDIVRE